MGQGGNGMKQDQLKQLVLLTNKKLGKKEIVSCHKIWHQLYHEGTTDKQGFEKYIEIAMPEVPKNSNLDYLFRAMDRNSDGVVTFQEFVVFQSIVSAQELNVEEFVPMVFAMYDINSDGKISRSELRDCMINVFHAKGNDVSLPQVLNELDKRCDMIFKIADSNSDQMLTLEEVLMACKGYPDLLGFF